MGPMWTQEISPLTPESFTVEGEQREVNHTKKAHVNKEKEAKKEFWKGIYKSQKGL